MTGVIWTAPPGTTGLIFDCDGTLADTMPVHFTAWAAMLAPHGVEFPEAQFYALAGHAVADDRAPPRRRAGRAIADDAHRPDGGRQGAAAT